MVQSDHLHLRLPLAANQRLKADYAETDIVANQRLKADYAETDIVVKRENKGAIGPLWY
jgi:hypothetical protein